MKPGNPSRDNPPRKKAVQSLKLPCRDKVWVYPKSYVKNLCVLAWKPPESVKTKAAAAGNSDTSDKVCRGCRED